MPVAPFFMRKIKARGTKEIRPQHKVPKNDAIK